MKHFLKQLYKLIPFKHAIFRGLKLFWKPSENVYKHLHFSGIIKVNSDENSSFRMHHVGHQIENELFWDGIENAWEKNSIILWLALSKKAKTVLDIGAYSGVYSLITSSLNPNSKIFAFEPVIPNLELLNKNITLNKYSNIKVIPKASSNFTGEAIIHNKIGATLNTAVSVNKNLYFPNTITEEIPIKTIRVDEFFMNENLDSLDLIKLDVETHEFEVLQGMGKLIERFKPTFLIEILNDEVGGKVQSVFDTYNYLYFDIDERGEITKVDSIKKSSYYNYLVCQTSIAEELNLI